MILFVNACARRASRTLRLAKALLAEETDEIQTVDIAADIPEPLTAGRLRIREAALSERDFSHPILAYARQFAAADVIYIASPHWDLSFPAVLKIYMELVCAVGVTFDYSPQGRPVSLCNAKKLVYVTTAGGYISPADHGFGYIKELGETFFGIPDIRCIKAEGLDIEGSDPEKLIMEAAEQNES